MGNVTSFMIGNLLTLFTAVATFGLAAVALQNLIARRVRVLARDSRESTQHSTDSNAS
jgi:hypothetical protein